MPQQARKKSLNFPKKNHEMISKFPKFSEKSLKVAILTVTMNLKPNLIYYIR